MRRHDPKIQALYIRLKNCRGLRGKRFTERFVHVLVKHNPNPALDILINCEAAPNDFLEKWFESSARIVYNKVDRIIKRMQERGIYPTRDSLISPDINLNDLVRLTDSELAESVERIIARGYRRVAA